MNNIPCEIIQDLLPSYVDGLTNDVTNAAIEEHVESCEKCRQILEGMRDGIEKQYVPDDSDKKEIDFLKKNKKERALRGGLATKKKYAKLKRTNKKVNKKNSKKV